MKRRIYNRLKEISRRIKKQYHAEKVILYGSYARDEATRDSDIDLLVVAPTRERFFKRMATVRGIMRDLRNGLPLSPVVFTPKEVKDRKENKDPFIESIMDEGVAL